MPDNTTPAFDASPFLDPALLQRLAMLSNYGPGPGVLPTTGGQGQQQQNNGGFLGQLASYANPLGNLLGFNNNNNSTIGNIASILDPIGGGFLGGLFGGGHRGPPPFQPYVNQQGQYVWTSPSSANPVPIATVPGAPIGPGRAYQDTAANIQAMTDLLPYFNQAVNQSIVPNAIAQLQGSAATSPGYAQLMTQLYNTYGPQLNAIGNVIANRNAMAQAQTERQVLEGPGKDLVNSALQLSQTFDRPFYQTRDVNAGRLNDLLQSIDLSGGLSQSERGEIQKGLALQNARSGSANAPSQAQTVANAQQFGQAGYGRQQQAKSNLAQAINSASAFLPASKSGVDVFQVATGRPSYGSNTGNQLFPGINNTSSAGAQSANLGGQIFGGIGSLQQQQYQLDLTKQLNTKDWLDKFNQFTSGLGNLASIGGAAGAFCWVAREVYGENNPRWKMFREWLYTKSPRWFFNLYVNRGERFAKWLHNKPKLKTIIKLWMESRISKLEG